MADEKHHEPQSYGSQGEWEHGDVGQRVTRLKGRPNSQHADFYESRIGHEHTTDGEGGFTSPVQANDVEHPPWHGSAASETDEEPVWKIDGQPTGAKRGSYFRKRDYK